MKYSTSSMPSTRCFTHELQTEFSEPNITLWEVLYMEKIIGFSQISCYFVQCISWDKAVVYLLYYWQTCMYSTVCV